MDNYYIQMAVIVSGYAFGIMSNVLLLWSTATENKVTRNLRLYLMNLELGFNIYKHVDLNIGLYT